MNLENVWADFRPQHYVIFLLAVLLFISGYRRAKTGKTNQLLLGANIAVALSMVFALPPVYRILDPLLGGINLVNFLTHLGVAVAGWIVTISLTKTIHTSHGKYHRPWYMNLWVPALLLIALFLVFIPLGTTTPSEAGLYSYNGSHLWYIAYQPLTISGFLCGANYLIPRLAQSLGIVQKPQYKIQLALYIATYALCSLILIASIIELLHPHMAWLREISYYLACLFLTGALMIASQEKTKALRKTQSKYQ